MKRYSKNETIGKRYAVVLIAISAALIQGCSESGSDPVDPIPKGTWQSACYNSTGGGGYNHRIHYDGFDFTINFSTYQSASCEGRASKASHNWMQGKFLPGDVITSQDGLQVLEMDYLYNGSDINNRESFDPSPYEIVYFDQLSGDVFLGMKSRRGSIGFTPETRPTKINFSNVWKKL